MRAVMLIGSLISLLIIGYLTMKRDKVASQSAAKAATAQGIELPKEAKGDIKKIPGALEKQLNAMKKKQQDALEAP